MGTKHTVQKMTSGKEMSMKKSGKGLALVLAIAFILAFTLSACGSENASVKENNTEQSTADAGEADKKESADNNEPGQNSETGLADSEDDISDANDHGKDVLVVYFSATGTTKGVAEKIADITGADIYEIVAAQEYTSDDLNYNDPDSRTSLEQNDPSMRPEIGSDEISFDGYSTIFIGYPIWWGQEPRIMDTFVENHEFDGITLIPFCTSGSSGIGRSGQNLADNAGSGNWLDGQRFSGSVSEDELQKWIDGFHIKKERDGDAEAMMKMRIGDTLVAVDWEENDSVQALRDLCSDTSLTVHMSMYGGFEQVGSIGTSLPRNDVQTTTGAGDIVLYSGNQIVIFYGSNSWAYTRLGHITDQDAAGMAELLGNGDVTITISME